MLRVKLPCHVNISTYRHEGWLELLGTCRCIWYPPESSLVKLASPPSNTPLAKPLSSQGDSVQVTVTAAEGASSQDSFRVHNSILSFRVQGSKFSRSNFTICIRPKRLCVGSVWGCSECSWLRAQRRWGTFWMCLNPNPWRGFGGMLNHNYNSCNKEPPKPYSD